MRRRPCFAGPEPYFSSTRQGEYITMPCWLNTSRTASYSFIMAPRSERVKAARMLMLSDERIAAKPVGCSVTSTMR